MIDPDSVTERRQNDTDKPSRQALHVSKNILSLYIVPISGVDQPLLTSDMRALWRCFYNSAGSEGIGLHTSVEYRNYQAAEKVLLILAAGLASFEIEHKPLISINVYQPFMYAR